jgi:hypothetical protein
MNLSIFLILFGVLLLFVPQTAWMGIAVLAIGAITYGVFQRQPAPAQAYPGYMQAFAPKRMQRTGINVLRKQPTDQQQQGPGIKEGMFSLPLPIDDDVGRFVDVSYKTPTGAQGFTEEKEKKHPFLPGF